MFYFDPMYFVFALPALILAMFAQWRVTSAVNKYSRVQTARGQTGARVARALFDYHGLQDVAVERGGGLLSDHYDPRTSTHRLPPPCPTLLAWRRRCPRCWPTFSFSPFRAAAAKPRP